MNLTQSVQMAGFRFSYRNSSAPREEQEATKETFERALANLDAFLSEHNGPFMNGDQLSAIDMMVVPSLERFRFQLPYTRSFDVLDEDKYPSLKKWFSAMDSLPSYKNRVRGDEMSWVTTTSVFARLFSPKKEDGSLPQEVQDTIQKVDGALDSLVAKSR